MCNIFKRSFVNGETQLKTTKNSRTVTLYAFLWILTDE